MWLKKRRNKARKCCVFKTKEHQQRGPRTRHLEACGSDINIFFSGRAHAVLVDLACIYGISEGKIRLTGHTKGGRVRCASQWHTQYPLEAGVLRLPVTSFITFTLTLFASTSQRFLINTKSRIMLGTADEGLATACLGCTKAPLPRFAGKKLSLANGRPETSGWRPGASS